MNKVKIKQILNKKGKKPIVCLTAYSKTVAQILDKYCDIILVGDSLGMVLYGMKSTKEVQIKTMMLHAKTVKKESKNSLVVVDMPYKTYSNKSNALRNARKIFKETNCDAVKLEGGKKIVKYIKKRTYPGSVMNGMLVYMADNQAEGADAAIEFLLRHEDVWKKWVSPKVAKQIKTGIGL